MKIDDLIALKDFSTRDSTGKITGVKGEPLPPMMYSTAKRLIQGGYARRKRTKAQKGA